MLTYTHVSRIGTDQKDSNGKEIFRVIQTPGVEIPTTLDDVRELLTRPEYSGMVKLTLNEQGGDLKQQIEVPMICKLIINSIGLKVNAQARQGEGINPLKLASEALASGNPELMAQVTKAMAGGKDTLKAWAEAYAKATAK